MQYKIKDKIKRSITRLAITLSRDNDSPSVLRLLCNACRNGPDRLYCFLSSRCDAYHCSSRLCGRLNENSEITSNVLQRRKETIASEENEKNLGEESFWNGARVWKQCTCVFCMISAHRFTWGRGWMSRQLQVKKPFL